MFRLGAARLMIAGLTLSTFRLSAQIPATREPNLPRQAISEKYFGADAPWFLANIPFFEIDDLDLQQIYYYRWKVFRSHIRQIGPQGTTVLEFLGNVPWARQPYTDLNDSASFHILEGRWLRNPAVVDSLIDHLYAGGANDRHFSESIAAATEASVFVTGDPAPALRHLDTMQHIYNLWDDHFDRKRNLYWIEPLLDATEYTISSIDASGAGFTDRPSSDQNRNGFTGGYAFRPSINSYQYGNALAIAHVASLAGKPDIAADYRQRAEKIRSAVLTQLWNPDLLHFTDRYQRGTPFVTAGDFIRGRELVGYVPWLYELPPNDPNTSGKYDTAWQHVLSPKELAGVYGLRTVEPSYPRYLAQYRYDQATSLPECQWNGPSWPFQTSQALTALANLLHDYPPAQITRGDYLHLLRQYAHQHFFSTDNPDIQEDYNPDTGKPIVGLPRSHHYEHSTFVDLIMSGLIGIRPRADSILEIDPLLPIKPAADEKAIRYFALEDLKYHGHNVSIIYDADGSRYHIGVGLMIFVDGTLASGPGSLAHTKVKLLPAPQVADASRARIDLAINPGLPDGPSATASSAISEASIAEAIDGRLWFFPEIPNGWSPSPTDSNPNSWYDINFGRMKEIGSIELYFFADEMKYEPPFEVQFQYRTASGWASAPNLKCDPKQPLANGKTMLMFSPVSTQEVRITFENPSPPSALRLIEIEAFAPDDSEKDR